MKQKKIFSRLSAMLVIGLAVSLALFLSPAVTAMAAPPNFPSFTELYTVTQTDNNIQSLAQEFGTTPDAIIAANNIADPANINYGQQLWVPPAASAAMVAPAMTAAPAAPAARVPGLASPATANPSFTQTYTVVQGDNLWTLARKYGTTINDLASANGIADPSKLSIGQQLHVPTAPAAPSGSPNSTAPTSPAMPASPGTAPSGQ
jgi:LysM repeat protein